MSKMSYENAVKKIKKLENKGYLNYGDRSTEYSYDPNICYRWFTDMDNETESYLREKIKKMLIKEKVWFDLGYSLKICPHQQMKDIVESAETYAEMAQKLNKLPFISNAREQYGKIEMRINATANGKQSDNLAERLLQVFCEEICNDTIYYENTGSGSYMSHYLHSKKCEDIDNVKREIDKLFEEE